MGMPSGTRWGWSRIGRFIVSSAVLATVAACGTVTRSVIVTNAAGKPVTMKITTTRFSDEFVRATVEGDKVGVSDPVKSPDGASAAVSSGPVIKSVGCSYCAFVGGRWVYYPPTCICP